MPAKAPIRVEAHPHNDHARATSPSRRCGECGFRRPRLTPNRSFPEGTCTFRQTYRLRCRRRFASPAPAPPFCPPTLPATALPRAGG